MSRDEALQMVCHAIAQIQEQSGRKVDVLNEHSRPFVDVDGFDSLNGEEVTALLLEDLSFGRTSTRLPLLMTAISLSATLQIASQPMPQ